MLSNSNMTSKLVEQKANVCTAAKAELKNSYIKNLRQVTTLTNIRSEKSCN